jgi:hypothetical protein
MFQRLPQSPKPEILTPYSQCWSHEHTSLHAVTTKASNHIWILLTSHLNYTSVAAQCRETNLWQPNTVKPLSIVPGSIVQFLWSLSESYFNYGSRIYCFPRSIVSFSDPRRKRRIEVSLYWHTHWTYQNTLCDPYEVQEPLTSSPHKTFWNI